MKYSNFFKLSLLVSSLTLLAYCKQSDPEPDVFVQREDALTIAQVRSFNSSSVPTSIRITDAGKEGVFKLDQTDQTSPDNAGITLVTVKGYRYKREFTGSANAFWFGVTESDDDMGPELIVAIRSTNDITIPDGTYTQLTPANLRSNLTLRGNPGKAIIKLPKSHVSLGALVNATDNSSINDVMIDGLTWIVSSQEIGQYGTIAIDGPSVSNLTIQNCSGNDAAAKDSTNWLTLKIQAGHTASNIIVRNNTVQAKRMACEIFNHDNINVYAGTNITVSGNTFSNCHFGISLSGPLDQLTVDNNYIKNCSLYGIEIAGASHNVKITNNKFEGVFDKFLAGSNDGAGNGTIVGGMIISGNTTVGQCKGGVLITNGGTVQFTKNVLNMTGMIELKNSTAGGTFSENVIESLATKAIICDDTPNHTFTNNTISNKNCPVNQATILAYGPKAVNNVITKNILIQGVGGKPYDAVLGATIQASQNRAEAGNLIP
ncbi:right-handed parallel beta-helix repeat-containing protein [Spirosoma pollinicola]|uniref:Right handed beta helix domain-containing protein n=1 Tax=Spirosoma pollinicola TaxID=2057025 RepID=A0A2K8YYD6_9BACT|nr:right-handed parallel beta-helix repeat-containing protein [Spirosoma pollinicola]AUD02594.1 hypothetical protein CWM47_12575 [Spirosoma pollinicola]